jgi:hypothetical protein
LLRCAIYRNTRLFQMVFVATLRERPARRQRPQLPQPESTARPVRYLQQLVK